MVLRVVRGVETALYDDGAARLEVFLSCTLSGATQVDILGLGRAFRGLAAEF